MSYGLLARLTVTRGEAPVRDPEFMSDSVFTGDRRIVGDETFKLGDAPKQLGEFAFFAFKSDYPIKIRLRTSGFEVTATHFSIGAPAGSAILPELTYVDPGAGENCQVQFIGTL